MGNARSFELTPQHRGASGPTRSEVPKAYAGESVAALLNDTRAAVLTKQEVQAKEDGFAASARVA